MTQHINSPIIEPAFAALLSLVDDQSELHFELSMLASATGPFSVQKKGSKIIESYPWPIGKELSALFSSSYNAHDQKRLLKLFRVAERLAQFLAFCWLVQLWDAKRANSSLELSPDFQAQFRNFDKPTIGTYLGIIRSSSNLLFDNALPIFFREKDIRNLTKRLTTSIEKLTEFRNREMHFKEEIICEDAEEILAEVLVSSAFLANYPMVSVKDINVFKHKLSTPKYVHVIDQLNSQRPDFLGGKIELDNFSESFSVLLIENLQSMGSYLNLSPFVINTEPFLSARGRSNVLQGLYLYLETSREVIKYTFVTEAEVHNLDEMPQKEVFEKQWKNLTEVLS